MDEKIKLYNDLSNVCLINLFSLSKVDKKIVFKNFDFKNKKHLCLLNIAKNVHIICGHDIVVECDFLSYLKYKIKYKQIKFIKRQKIAQAGIDINNFLQHITNAHNVSQDIWEDIYDDFFGGQ